MRILLLVCLFLISDLAKSRRIDLKHLRCLVCRATMKELEYEMLKSDPNRLVEVGNYRMDAEGNTIHKKIPLRHSEVHLAGILDTVCHKLSNYVRATKKSNNRLTIVNLLSSDNDMNPRLGAIDIIQDDDLNRSLEHYCSGIIDEFEDNIVSLYVNDVDNKKETLCTDVSKICENYVDDDDEDFTIDKKVQFEKLAQELLRDEF